MKIKDFFILFVCIIINIYSLEVRSESDESDEIDKKFGGRKMEYTKFRLGMAGMERYIIEKNKISLFRKYLDDGYLKYYKIYMPKDPVQSYEISKNHLIFRAVEKNSADLSNEKNSADLNKVLVKYFYGSLDKYKKMNQKEIILTVIEKLNKTNPNKHIRYSTNLIGKYLIVDYTATPSGRKRGFVGGTYGLILIRIRAEVEGVQDMPVWLPAENRGTGVF